MADIADFSASYLFGIARGHPFADGNKRMALAAALVFLDINGFDLHTSVTDDELTALVRHIASNETTENELATWIRARLLPLAE